MVKESNRVVEPSRARGLAIVAIVFAIASLLPGLFIYALRFIGDVTSGGFSQSQGYLLLLPSLIAYVLTFTLAPVAGITALILSIVTLVRSKPQAGNIAIVALILVGLWIIITLTLLFGLK
jgi:hypothetical protein